MFHPCYRYHDRAKSKDAHSANEQADIRHSASQHVWRSQRCEYVNSMPWCPVCVCELSGCVRVCVCGSSSRCTGKPLINCTLAEKTPSTVVAAVISLRDSPCTQAGECKHHPRVSEWLVYRRIAIERKSACTSALSMWCEQCAWCDMM